MKFCTALVVILPICHTSIHSDFRTRRVSRGILKFSNEMHNHGCSSVLPVLNGSHFNDPFELKWLPAIRHLRWKAYKSDINIDGLPELQSHSWTGQWGKWITIIIPHTAHLLTFHVGRQKWTTALNSFNHLLLIKGCEKGL